MQAQQALKFLVAIFGWSLSPMMNQLFVPMTDARPDGLTIETPTPECKGKDTSLMISDFLVPEWGQLKDDEE